MKDTTPASTLQFTPELLEALTKQLLEKTPLKQNLQEQNKSLQTPPQPFVFGNYKLTPFSQTSPNHFKACLSIEPHQQCLLDYAWGAKNRQQMTVALQALTTYFSIMNARNKQHSGEVSDTSALRPEVPHKKLENKIKEIEVENIMLKEALETYKQQKSEFHKLKKYVEGEEQTKQEEWRKFPSQINETKREVLDIVLSDHIGNQLYLQQLFRRLAGSHQLINGLAFKATTYKDNNNKTKQFSFLSCSINLKIWKPCKIEGADFGLTSLLNQGVLHRLLVTEKSQIQRIPGEKLSIILMQLMDEDEHAKLELLIHSIPPSYYPGHLDDARHYIIIRQVRQAYQQYALIPSGSLISEEEVELLDQLNSYRSLVYNKKPQLRNLRLVGEEKHCKIYYDNMGCSSIHTPFSRRTTEFPEDVLYYDKISAKYFTEEIGDTTTTADSDDDMMNEDNQADDELLHNLQNNN